MLFMQLRGKLLHAVKLHLTTTRARVPYVADDDRPHDGRHVVHGLQRLAIDDEQEERQYAGDGRSR